MRLLVAFTLVSAVIAIPIPQPGPQSSSDSQATPNPQSTPDPQSTPQTPRRPDWESDPSLPPDSSGVNAWNGIPREGKAKGRIEDEDPPEWASHHNWGRAATDTLNAGKTVFGAGAAATGLKPLWDIYSLEGAAAWQLLKPSIRGDRGFFGGP